MRGITGPLDVLGPFSVSVFVWCMVEMAEGTDWTELAFRTMSISSIV